MRRLAYLACTVLIPMIASAAPPQRTPTPTAPTAVAQPARFCQDAYMILMDFNLDLKWNRIESTRPYWVQHDYKEIDTEQFIRRIAAKCHPGDRIDLPRGALYPRLCDPGQPITQINGDVVCTMAPL